MSLSSSWQIICRKVTNVTQMMARNPETTIVCLALLFQLLMTRLSVTWSGAATDDTPTPRPNRIFPPSSLVYDFPDGSLESAQQRINAVNTDVSVAIYYAHWDGTSLAMAQDFHKMARAMMGRVSSLESAQQRINAVNTDISVAIYYAHWDGTSLAMAQDFHKMARAMMGRVTFVAVNCWWPYGTCRQKIQAPYYPVLIVHHGEQEGLQYKGIMIAPEIQRFLNKVIAPFVYITDRQMLQRLQALEDTLVIAYFNFTKYQEEEAPGFDSFHRAALLSLEKDPIQHIQFAVITNPELAKSLNLTTPKSIVLLTTLGEPMYYPPKRTFKAKFIMHWVFDRREKLVQWLVPVGVKSLIMSKQLQTKPAVILFTPHMHSNSFLNNIHLLRILAMDYYNCNSSTHIYHRIQQIEEERHRLVYGNARTPNSEQCCQTVALTTKLPHIADIPIGRQNVCEVCEQFTQPPRMSFDPCSYQNCDSTVLNTVIHNFATSPDSCLHVDNYYSPYSHFELCCKSRILSKVHERCSCHTEDLLHQKRLHRSDNSIILDPGIKCKTCEPLNTYKFKTLNQKVLNRYKNCTEDETFSGLGCRTNKSVNFFAMRMDLYEDFAKRLGLRRPVMDAPLPESALVLIDIKREIQHMLPIEDSLSTSHLQDLLVNFTRANLSRHLRSTKGPPSSSVFSTSVEDNELNISTGYTVQEVVSASFEAVVLHSKQNVLLLYYAPWCGFCAQLHYLYQVLANILQDTPNLTIARINGDLNDLPWEFTVPQYPTLLLYPATRKDNSIRYPEERPINLPNLLRFVIENIQ